MNIQITDEQIKELVEKEVKNTVKAWFTKENNNMRSMVKDIVAQEVRFYLHKQNLDVPKIISDMQTEVLAEKITSHIGESIADYFREKYYYD